MPNSLFIKVFLGFWLVTLLIAAGWRVTGEYLDELPRASGPGDRTEHLEGPPQRYLLRLVYNLQTLADSEIPPLIGQYEQQYGITVYLLDNQGNELLGRSVPPRARELATRLKGPRRRIASHEHGRHMIAHEIYRRDEGIMRAVVVFPPPRHRVLGLLVEHKWLRLGLALLISGLLCYALTRLLTGRLGALQKAAGRIAAGDLDARLVVRPHGGDETDQLARDFNTMAEQLQARMQAQRRLLRDVSHELRSPLARLRVAIALAQDNPDTQALQLERMEREVERLEALIAELLSTQQDTLVLDSHVDLANLLSELCEDARFEGAQRGIDVTLVVATDQALVACSAELLHRALENVLRNAVRHSPDNGSITVTLSSTGDDYRIEVQDQGPGLQEAELSKIFDAFYRADESRTPGEAGYGLGLAIARRAIGLHGGDISARNCNPGLCVAITLPADGRASTHSSARL